ncbi:photosystem II stability/assembly factor-like uncharacterized protein [Natronocella acetinitrilica]|uniref:Photosystem II stability/assembly factor-like uncharacterized protein n=1 Tax=Natronocella acetinitrilica TaxID=414046 RepID=A0AAE3G139_9GAMM|nr:sialidase family protein [Natronocella acetinitrilica]MCP1673620.1 photosystem II stability/assembly factor-like uncharacterized protein [Natronocella acetinitrilica]
MTDAASPPGGRATRTVLLVGTQKGLFRLEANKERTHWQMQGPLIPGYEILQAWIDPRDSRTGYAAVNHVIWGSHIYRSIDAGLNWQPLDALPSHPAGRHQEALHAIWCLTPGLDSAPGTLYAGIDPAGLFVSNDAGESWSSMDGLNLHPTRDTWEPAKGGFSLHSIHQCPTVPERLYAAISAGGVYRSDDGGEQWYPINRDVRAENLPQRYAESGHNVHRLVVHPRDPDRLYRQCYNGVYRSDDGGLHWQEISAGLPSDFGYALATEEDNPDSVWVVPIASNHLRTTPDGRLRVYRSRNGGNDWTALTDGLPQHHAYVTVLRENLALDSRSPMSGAYLGTSSGHVFASRDGGDSWQCIAEFLPRILSVKVCEIDEAHAEGER